MKLGQALKMAVRSIGASKARTALTMLGIVIGVASVVIMVSVVQGSNQKQLEYFEKMGNNKISVNIYSSMVFMETGDGASIAVSSGPVKDVGRMLYDYCGRQPDLITGVTAQGYVSGLVISETRNSDKMENGAPNISLGNEKFSVCNNFQLAKGRDISYLDVKNYHQVVVLGAALAKYLFQSADPVGKSVAIAGHPFTVIGVYAAKDPNSEYSMDNMAVVPESVNRTLNKNEPITSYVVKAKSSSAVQKAITGLNSFLKAQMGDGNFNVYSENQFLDESKEQNKMMSLVLGGIAGISLLVGGIGIMNIMLVTVSERTREIGVRRAIGAPRASIMAQFLVEAAVVCGAGGIIGIGLGVLGSLIAGKLLLKMLLFPNTGLAVGAFLFSVLLGIGFGMYPAAKASGLTPVEALRSE
ncbi:MAG: FtsX-like permease family protein [Oscillibacter sp.]|nr:FtsX-like permease family protein [Oscillibacter sp.]